MANDVYELIILGTCADEFFECVQHYESGVSGAPNPVAVASNLIAAWKLGSESAMADLMGDDSAITGYKSKRVNNGGSPTVMLPQTPVAGTIASTSATSATASCIVSSYSQGAKYRTGRMFIPGLPISELDGNSFSAGHIGNAATFVTTSASIANGGQTFTFGVWARKTSTFFVPAYRALSPKPGIQRRRLLPVM